MIVGHIGGAGALYEIRKSLRFRVSASAYLSRTPSVAGNRKTWTWSGWVKRGTLGSGVFDIFSSRTVSETTLLRFNADTIAFIQQNASVVIDANYSTTAIYRDPSAWYHVVLAIDTPQSVAGGRVRLYVNGAVVSLTASVTIVQNSDTQINRAAAHAIGVQPTQSSGYFDGYLSEINFIDGQALGPEYFGEVSAETGAWVPKKYTGTYGTNGFYLPFNDGSNLTNLTADRSGNGNNWTANNISLTSGVTYDWMDDTPSNNFAVLNPIGSYPGALREGNLATNIAGLNTNANSSIGVSAGKWYWEVRANTPGANGIVNTSFPFWYAWVPGQDANSVSYYSSGTKYENGLHTAYGAAYGAADIVGMALDMNAGTLTCYKNNVSQGVLKSGLTGIWFPSVGANDVNTQYANFGQRPFAYTPPAGFKALCTKNLPTPSILNPKKHFDVKTRTGTGAAATVTGIPFAPDLVWIKTRAAAYSHNITDSVRGAAKTLISNATAAEEQNRTVGYVSAFTSDGYSLSAGSSNIDEVGSATTYVDWLWKAGGAPVTNNAGSIQSQVSANPQAGFSIVTYTGTGANATVGHGLGVAPKMVIVKSRNAATNWPVWHGSIAGTQFLLLNTVEAVGTAANVWNSTTPTSSIFSVGTNIGTNNSGTTHVAYCFAEIPGYSKIGSYVGNGSADGPFVYCGFRPRFVMIKRVDSTSGWVVIDAARDIANQAQSILNANISDAEAASYGFDFISNGLKVRNTGINASGGTYIFAAFAEQPFQFANAR